MIIAPLPPREVPWRSGDAPDCKSVYPGSIPGGTSNFLIKLLFLLDYFLNQKNSPTFIPTFKLVLFGVILEKSIIEILHNH